MTPRIGSTLGLVVVLVSLWCMPSARAESRRFALLVGAATGDAGEDRLRFSEADAERIAATLRDVGGFAPEDVVVLSTVSASEFRRALISINARIRQVAGDSLLLVFYSGHADADALQMAGTRLPSAELRDLIYGSPATARVLIVDACRSGAVTRIKGGRRVPSFTIDVEDSLRSKGVAILTSSAAGEDSQESDALGASFFTHYLASGLRGAADEDGDARVTLSEAFTYASERTLSATARTYAGPQHPTYKFDLAGRQDLVLTRPIAGGQRIGTLGFREPGAYFVRQRDVAHAATTEVDVSGSPRSIAVPAGDYLVTRRATNHLLQGAYTVEAGKHTPVREAHMEKIAYAQVVRKGGTALRRSASGFVTAAVRGGLGDLGRGLGVEGGLRLDMSAFSAELRLQAIWFDSAKYSNEEVIPLGPVGSSGTVPAPSARELGATLVGLRAFDLRPVTLAVGAAAGGMWFARAQSPIVPSYTSEDNQLAFVVGGVVQAQRQLAGPVYARLELGALGYIFIPPPDTPLTATIVWSTNLGLGTFF